MRCSAGDHLGPYVILAALGAGGMGEVYRARDTRLSREVALKILPENVARDPDRIARFEHEARSVSALNHPNIISVYDIGGESGIAYTISELVDGESLRQIISRGPLPVRRIIEICQQIAEGISAAHAAGIVHRDLKPENIMVRRDGRVKILDFGLAKRTINARSVGPTAPTITATTTQGMVIGTPAYMAPEQVRGEAVDERSDIFSFGLIMYEMATGQAAFSKSSTVETMHAILTEEPPEISGSVPRTFASVLQRCLEKEPARRFQSASDLGFALTVLVSTAAHAIVPARSPLSRRNFIWTGTTVICTAAGTSVGYLHRRKQSEPPRFRDMRTGRSPSVAFMDPEGRVVVYSSKVNGNHSFAFDVSTGFEHELSFPQDSLLQDLSSKGELAFVRDQTLYRVGLVNAAPRALAADVYQARWSLRGEDLVVFRKTERQFLLEYPIGKVLQALRSPRSLSGVNRDGLIAFVDFSDDGQSWFIVVDASGRERTRRLVTKSAGAVDQRTFWSPSETEIWSAPFEPGEPRGTLVAYGVNGSRRVLARLPESVELCGVTATARTLLRLSYEERIPFAKAAGRAEVRPLLVDADPAALTEDGHYLALQSKWEQDRQESIWFQDLEAGGPPVLLGQGGVLAISPDGKWIGVLRPPYNCSLMPSGAGPEERLQVPGIQNPSLMGWRPGGHLVVAGFADDQSHGGLSIWTRGSSTAQRLPARIQKGQVPRGISPDGQQLLLFDFRVHLSFVQNLSGGNATLVEGLKPGEYVIGWTAEPGCLYIASGEASEVYVETYNLKTRNRTPWKTFSSDRPDMPITWIQINPDGRAWAYTVVRSSSRLVTIEDL